MLPHYLEKLWHYNYITAGIIEVFVNTVFSDEDKILKKNLYQLKRYKTTELINEFPNKWWTKSITNRLLKRLRDTGTVHRLTGSGRPRSAALKKMLIQLTIWF